MVIYIDILIAVNSALNYTVLITAEKLLKRNIRTYRLLLGAFTGALFSLTVFIDSDSVFISLMIKIVSSAVITLTAFGYHGKREYLKAVSMTVGVSLVYCGGLVLFYQLFRPPNMLIINDIPYFELDPLLLILTTVIIYFLIVLFIKLFSERIKSTVVHLCFNVSGDEYSCIGKVDTGCSLVEPFSSSPVIIVKNSVFDTNRSELYRVVPYTTVNGSSYLKAIKADSVSIDRKAVNKSVYICSAPINEKNFDAIINSEIIR